MTREEFLKRETEIRQAINEYPGIEMGEAYRRWKVGRGEEPTSLSTGDKSLQDVKAELKKAHTKPCTQVGCSGLMHLEGVCSGCVEGRKGFKAKWTCDECLHRELSKQDYMEILRESSNG